MAPIRRVPSDILRTIFEHCLPTHRNPTMAAIEAPVVLTQVCSSWRSIAITSLRLWAQLHIQFQKEVEDDNFQRGDGQPFAPLQLITSVLQDRCHAVHEWLFCSADHPLSISVNYKQPLTNNPNVNSTESPGIDDLAVTLLNTLLVFSSRWRNFELNVLLSIYHKLESMLLAHTLPLLTQLRAVVYPATFIWSVNEISPPSIRLLQAPNLKRISIDYPRFIYLLRPTTQVARWTNITHASLSMSTLDDCISLLKMHPQLIHCTLLTVVQFGPVDSSTVEDSLCLPHLLSLCISTRSGYKNFTRPLYNIIHSPQLQSFGYYNSAGSYAGENSDSVTTDVMPPSFFHTATNITKLEIDRFFLMFTNVLDILEAQHALTHLSLTFKLGVGPRILSAATDPFDLEILVTRFDIENESIPNIAPTRQLLPHLKVFELHMTIVSDDLALRFVSSRMKPTSHIAVLKKVKIDFHRFKEKDGLDLANAV